MDNYKIDNLSKLCMLNVIQINALKLRIVRNFVIIINYYEKERKLFTMKKENNKKKCKRFDRCGISYGNFGNWTWILTQTGKFTDSLHGSFGFVILISVILAAIVQLKCMESSVRIWNAWTGCGE